MTKERNISLDIIRILACMMVVLMHSPLPGEGAVGAFLTPLSYATAPSIGLFFMVSGALLLPVKGYYFPFIRKRFTKVLIPAMVWSVVYLAVKLFYNNAEIDLLRCVLSIPFAAVCQPVLWFIYALVGLYLLAPILSAWLERVGQAELRFVLLLWAISLSFPLISNYIIIADGVGGPLYYFSGYAGYFLLGYYLNRYHDRVLGIVALVIALVGISMLLYVKTEGIEAEFYTRFWYLSIFVAAMAVVIWKAVVRVVGAMNLRSRQWVVTLSNLSFGIYLIHILIMRSWLWQQPWILNISNYPLQCLVIAAVTFVLSAFVCCMISLTPVSQYVIGCRRS